MVCPRWTQSMSQPIALSDVVDLTLHCLGRQETYGEWYDIGGPDSMSYIDMMKKTAALPKVKRIIKTIPVFSAHLSLRWVQLSRGPRELVSPLIESLRHDMVTRDRRLQDALESHLRRSRPPWRPLSKRKAIEASAPKGKCHVRPKAQVVYSVQRLLAPGMQR